MKYQIQYLLLIVILLFIVAQYVVTDYHPWDRIFRLLAVLVFAGTILFAGITHFQGGSKPR
jgi:hypothetical protein